MTFQQLQYLLEVARCGSVSRAADKLYLAQSSVSAAIGSLEKELGYPIFKRVKNGIVPTDQGQRVIEYAGQICESLRKMQTPDTAQKRHFRFSATDYLPFGKAFVRLVEEYKEEDVIFHWEPGGSTRVVDKNLITRKLEMALLLVHSGRLLEIQNRLTAEGLSCLCLGEERVSVVLGPGHRLYDRQQILPGELEQDTLVDSGVMVYNDFLKGVIRLDPDRTVFVSSNIARNLLLQQGGMFSIGNGSLHLTDQAYGLRKIPLADLTYTIVSVYLPEKVAQPECRRFLELVKEELAQRQ